MKRVAGAVLLVLVLVLALVSAGMAHGRTHRSAGARQHFRSIHPCPSTGRRTGACPGFTVDHRIALCVGGADDPSNMRWQENGRSFEKDRWECRRDWQKKLAACERSGCFEY